MPELNLDAFLAFSPDHDIEMVDLPDGGSMKIRVEIKSAIDSIFNVSKGGNVRWKWIYDDLSLHKSKNFKRQDFKNFDSAYAKGEGRVYKYMALLFWLAADADRTFASKGFILPTGSSANDVASKIIGKLWPDKTVRPQTNNTNSEDEVFGLAFEKLESSPKARDRYSISVNDLKQEPDFEGSLKAYLDLWFDRIYDSSTYALSFRQVRVHLIYDGFSDAEIILNQAYLRGRTNNEGVSVRLDGTKDGEVFYVSAIGENDLLYGTYNFYGDDLHLFEVLPQQTSIDRSGAVTVVLCVQLYDSHVVHSDGSRMSDKTRENLQRILFSQDMPRLPTVNHWLPIASVKLGIRPIRREDMN